MSLTYHFNSSQDIFEKLQRDSEILERETSGDGVFNFVITAYSLWDWIQKDPEFKSVLNDTLKKKIWQNKYFRVCRDLANASKHMEITYKPSVSETRLTGGYGTNYGLDYGMGAGHIVISLDNGEIIHFSELKSEIMNLWTNFFDDKFA